MVARYVRSTLPPISSNIGPGPSRYVYCIPTLNQERKILRPRATQVWDSRALRRTAYATAIITFAIHEANAPILTPHIPAMIAAATMALIATQIPQRRSGLR